MSINICSLFVYTLQCRYFLKKDNVIKKKKMQGDFDHYEFFYRKAATTAEKDRWLNAQAVPIWTAMPPNMGIIINWHVNNNRSEAGVWRLIRQAMFLIYRNGGVYISSYDGSEFIPITNFTQLASMISNRDAPPFNADDADDPEFEIALADVNSMIRSPPIVLRHIMSLYGRQTFNTPDEEHPEVTRYSYRDL